MKGYLNVDDGTFDEEGFYKTGDVMKVDDDGYFYIVDRIKVIFSKYLSLLPFDLYLIVLLNIGSLVASLKCAGADQVQRLPSGSSRD